MWAEYFACNNPHVHGKRVMSRAVLQGMSKPQENEMGVCLLEGNPLSLVLRAIQKENPGPPGTNFVSLRFNSTGHLLRTPKMDWHPWAIPTTFIQSGLGQMRWANCGFFWIRVPSVGFLVFAEHDGARLKFGNRRKYPSRPLRVGCQRQDSRVPQFPF